MKNGNSAGTAASKVEQLKMMTGRYLSGRSSTFPICRRGFFHLTGGFGGWRLATEL